MHTTTKRFTRSRLQLIIAALFAGPGTLLDTRYDSYIEKRVEEKEVIKERIVIGQPTAINVFRYLSHVPGEVGARTASSTYGYALTPDTAFKLGQAHAEAIKTVNMVTTHRALLIDGEYFLLSTINPMPIVVNPS